MTNDIQPLLPVFKIWLFFNYRILRILYHSGSSFTQYVFCKHFLLVCGLSLHVLNTVF